MEFNDRAKNWDTPFRMERAKKIATEIKSYVDISTHRNAMEFGCGTGLISFNLIDSLDHITLVDTSVGMIEILNEKIEHNGNGNMMPVQIDLQAASDYADAFDLIFSSMALHHVEDVESVLERLYDLLEEDGEICLVDLNLDNGAFHNNEKGFTGHHGFNQDELKALMTAIGFTNIQSKTFLHGHKERSGQLHPYSLFILKARR